MLEIKIIDYTGSFAENKDIARDLRLKVMEPFLSNNNDNLVLDFDSVTGATQSFIHALISELIRKYDNDIFARMLFKNCNSSIEQIVNIVADYMEAS